jgi:outer membrane protein assembly factor BamB
VAERSWLAGSANALAVSTAVLAGNTLVACYSGSLFALNATTGAVLWQATPGGTIVASPAVSGGPGNQAVFVGDLNDNEYGFSLATGAQLFSAAATGIIQESAAVADGALYFASNGTSTPTHRRDEISRNGPLSRLPGFLMCGARSWGLRASSCGTASSMAGAAWS